MGSGAGSTTSQGTGSSERHQGRRATGSTGSSTLDAWAPAPPARPSSTPWARAARTSSRARSRSSIASRRSSRSRTATRSSRSATARGSMKDGQSASLSDIKEGNQVRASYSGSGDTLQVSRIDVMTAGTGPAPASGTGSTGTGSTGTARHRLAHGQRLHCGHRLERLHGHDRHGHAGSTGSGSTGSGSTGTGTPARARGARPRLLARARGTSDV